MVAPVETIDAQQFDGSSLSIAMRAAGSIGLAALLALVLASCGARAGASTKRVPGPQDMAATRAPIQRLLEGDGIGSVKFGQRPAVVAATLGRLFGPPVGASQIPNGYRRDVCGFYSQEWSGLGAASTGRLFVAELNVWVRNSRFAGYSFLDNNIATDFKIDWNQYASHPMMLATPSGLTVGDQLARARELYGQNLVVTTQMQGTPPNPRLERLPVWEASTTSGRIEGGIGRTILTESNTGNANHRTWSQQRSISSIGAGAGPDTPC